MPATVGGPARCTRRRREAFRRSAQGGVKVLVVACRRAYTMRATHFPSFQELPMADLVLVVDHASRSSSLCVAYVAWCDRIIGADDRRSVDGRRTDASATATPTATVTA